VELDSTAEELLARGQGLGNTKPFTVAPGTGPKELIKLMQLHAIRQVPVVDDGDRVVDLKLLSGLVGEMGLDEPAAMRAVIMAGGFGTRLRPLTDQCPKPLLQVGEKPILSRIIERLKLSGIKHVSLSTHYMGERIKERFGNGDGMGVEIRYLKEDKPLGTAGAIGYLDPADEPLLVINGDIITDLDPRAMLAFHREQEAELTVAVRKYEVNVPFGVVETTGSWVTGLTEKPSYSFFVNAGIYLLGPAAVRLIQTGIKMDMTDLIGALVARGGKVASFPVVEYWLDVGNPEDYQKAQQYFNGDTTECG